MQDEISFLKDRAKIYVTEINKTHDEEKQQLLDKIKELEINLQSQIKEVKSNKPNLSNISFSADLSMFQKDKQSLPKLENNNQNELEHLNKIIENLRNSMGLQSQEINVLRKVNDELYHEIENIKKDQEIALHNNQQQTVAIQKNDCGHDQIIQIMHKDFDSKSNNFLIKSKQLEEDIERLQDVPFNERFYHKQYN